jgi:hypothetical protein
MQFSQLGPYRVRFQLSSIFASVIFEGIYCSLDEVILLVFRPAEIKILPNCFIKAQFDIESTRDDYHTASG